MNWISSLLKILRSAVFSYSSYVLASFGDALLALFSGTLRPFGTFLLNLRCLVLVCSYSRAFSFLVVFLQ